MKVTNAHREGRMSKGQFPVLAAFIISRPGDANLHQSLARSYPPPGLPVRERAHAQMSGLASVGSPLMAASPVASLQRLGPVNSELYLGPGNAKRQR